MRRPGWIVPLDGLHHDDASLVPVPRGRHLRSWEVGVMGRPPWTAPSGEPSAFRALRGGRAGGGARPFRLTRNSPRCLAIGGLPMGRARGEDGPGSDYPGERRSGAFLSAREAYRVFACRPLDRVRPSVRLSPMPRRRADHGATRFRSRSPSRLRGGGRRGSCVCALAPHSPTSRTG